jgi:hypothetical protein
MALLLALGYSVDVQCQQLPDQFAHPLHLTASPVPTQQTVGYSVYPGYPKTNDASALENGTDSIEHPDPFEQGYLQPIARIEIELGNTNLDPRVRSLLETNLHNLYTALDTLRLRQKARKPGMELGMVPYPPKLPSFTNSTHAMVQQAMADHATNAQLWANLIQAQIEATKNGDKAAVGRAERKLADYLEEQFGRINGTNYPPGMSLAQIAKEGRAKIGQKSDQKNGQITITLDRRKLVLTILVVVMLAPIGLFAFYKLRHRKV